MRALRRLRRHCHQTGLRPEPPAVRWRGPLRPAPLPPRRAVRALRRLRRRCHQTGLRPEPTGVRWAGTPAPRATPAEARRARLAPAAPALPIRRGCAPNPRRSFAGTPAPRATPAEARRARLAPALPSDGAASRTPGVRWRGPLRPAPLPPRRAVRAFLLGTHPGFVHPRVRPLPGGKLRRGCAPNPRRPLAGTPAPRATLAEARRARLAPALPSDGAASRTTGVRWRGPLRPAPLPPRRAVRALRRR